SLARIFSRLAARRDDAGTRNRGACLPWRLRAQRTSVPACGDVSKLVVAIARWRTTSPRLPRGCPFGWTEQPAAFSAPCARRADRDKTGWRRRRTLMTPPDVLARALAAALLDGDWEPAPMLARLREAIGTERPWMRTLVRAARSRHATAPSASLGDLAAWLSAHRSFASAMQEQRPIIRHATPAPEMAESPWRVPALATTRELAMWIGIDLDALEVLADRRGISRSSRDQRARHYRYAWIPKPSGGHRLIEAPKSRL